MIPILSLARVFCSAGLPADKLAAYQAALTKMYDTPEVAVRSRNGWVNIHNSGAAFGSFLEEQEKAIGDLMKSSAFSNPTDDPENCAFGLILVMGPNYKER